MSIKKEVEKIIEKRWRGLKDPEELISQYNIEKQTNQGYNGRQLLELFQNCEDEGATKVRISLDTKNRLLEISNNGEKPFSTKGYKSIFYPGLSSKVSSGYIGNKGLGFRSIINWANEIEIISNNFKVIFNTSYKKNILLNKIGYCEDELMSIRKDRKLTADTYPVPLLNCCEIIDLDYIPTYTTTISINYKKDFEDDIIKQIKSISLNTLLFLSNIKTIEIEGDVLNSTISINRTKIDENNYVVEFEDKRFYVLCDDGIVGEKFIDDKESSEPKRYSVKIAYNDDLTFKDNVLYNYFKTQIPFELPFVVHASLELDQNRNHSTDSKVNTLVLEKLFQLHLNFLEVLKTKHLKSWLPYLAVNNDDCTVYKPYSDLITEYWEKFEVYPTLSGRYYTNSQAKNLGNSLARFMQENQLEKHFEKQIIYCDLPINPQKYLEKPKNYVKIIENIANELNFKQRAKLIKILLESYPNEKFNVLKDENNQLIRSNDFVFTDKTNDNKSLKVPSYSKIRFLHPELYRFLIIELGLEKEQNKPRVLKDKLEKISDVQSFEPQTVIKKIIKETNDILNKNTLRIEDILVDFYKTLFHNYKHRGDNPELEYDSKIPCLNQLNQVADIKSLVLSDEFEIGKLSKKIFGNLYEKIDIIANLKNLGLANQDIIETENFLIWLGVNHFALIEMKSSNINQGYLNYTNKKNNTSISSYQLYSIKNIENKFSKTTANINQIIVWLSLDKKIKTIFSNFNLTHFKNEKLIYYWYGAKFISSFENFIHYSISNYFEIGNYLITNKKDEWFNPFKIDYEYITEINDSLNKSEIDKILFFLGAKKDFNDLDIDYLKKKTQELANKNNHKGAQVFYKSLVGHFKANGLKILDSNLYAKEGVSVVVKKASEIYFSDRIQLPEVLTNKFPIFYYPSRSGGASAIEMFGINNLNDLDLKVIKSEINNCITYDFEAYLKEIKPFILAFRLDKITREEVKKGQLQRLNKLNITCCSELVCCIDNEQFEIEPYNYVFNNDKFYISIPNNSTIASLKQNKQFIDNLSDIYLKVFDTLDEKKIFESILKQSKEDNIYDINNELAEGALEEAKILLGEISVRLSIWKSIFKLKNITNLTELNDNNLESNIINYFPEIEKDKLFDSDDNLNEIRKIREVFSILSLNLNDYNRICEYKLTFDRLFNAELNDFYDKKKKGLKNQVWNHLKNQDIEEQKKFLKYLHQIEHLLHEIILNNNSTNYDFESIILMNLENKFPTIQFSTNISSHENYDIIEQENIKKFSADELLIIRQDESLNSLSYFEGRMEYIQSEIKKKEEKLTTIEDQGFSLDLNKAPELIKNFEIEVDSPNFNGFKSNPWLGGDGELSSSKKKTLGINVEEVVKRYLDSKPNLYSLVEHISKTNEGEHYDLKYYDVINKKIKFVECKYYNGVSFYLTRDEKIFADKHSDQYEIWLVNKDSKIYCIHDINKLGELLPNSYTVNIKLRDYAI